jgi:hypothetical protein
VATGLLPFLNQPFDDEVAQERDAVLVIPKSLVDREHGFSHVAERYGTGPTGWTATAFKECSQELSP